MGTHPGSLTIKHYKKPAAAAAVGHVHPRLWGTSDTCVTVTAFDSFDNARVALFRMPHV